MRDQEIIGLWEAYQQVHAQPQEEVEVVDEARRADKEGYERGTDANPTRAQTDVPHSDPSQRTRLHSRLRQRSDQMGRERRNSPRNRSGGRTPVSSKEKAFLQAGDRTSPGRGHVRSPNVGDTGRHAGVSRSDREDSSNPRRNPRHNANKENPAESFDLFDYLLEYLVAEGYADTNKAAFVIMANMSEEWKQNIVEMSPAMQNLMSRPSNRLDGKRSPALPAAPQPPGGLTPMQRLQRRPDPTIR